MPCKINLSDDLTVFTGANDCGKTVALRALHHFCNQLECDEGFVNIDRHGETRGSWKNDAEIAVKATLQLGQSSISKLPKSGKFQAGDILHTQLVLTRIDGGCKIVKLQRKNSQVTPIPALPKKSLPSCTYIAQPDSISDVIDLMEPNETEIGFLNLAFGAQFTIETLKDLTPIHAEALVSNAQERLNAQFRRILPAGTDLIFRLKLLGEQNTLLGCYVVDDKLGFVPLSSRGGGIQRLVGIMSYVLQSESSSASFLLLMDEPENSLHADAQHQLRHLLEELAERPNTQIVYATHSPAMIPSRSPEKIRVFTRAVHSGKATSTVSTATYGENLQSVRISLGLTPADTLLYGSPTLLVEGDTEVRCLEAILVKLSSEGITGFSDVGRLLEGCVFVCGEGDNIPKYCRIIRAQNAEPIVLLDSDKSGIVEKIRKIDPEIPVIALEEGLEFEDLVPLDVYVGAVRRLLADVVCVDNLDASAFERWVEEKGLSEKMMTSKKIESWVTSEFKQGFCKHTAMENAIAECDASQIRCSELKRLVSAIRKVLK